MNDLQQPHQYQYAGRDADGNALYECPTCGRRIVFRKNIFDKQVLAPGDETAPHVGTFGAGARALVKPQLWTQYAPAADAPGPVADPSGALAPWERYADEAGL